MKNIRQKLVDEFIDQQYQTLHLVIREVRTVLKQDADSGSGYFPVIKVIRQSGPLSQHAIAEELGLSDAAISRQITILQEKGFIEAHIDPENRRQVLVNITEKGECYVSDLIKTVSTYMANLLEPISDEELKATTIVHKKLATIINERKSLHE